MPTGDAWVNLALKRFLSQNRIDENFLSYLKTISHDIGSRIFPEAGLFTFPVTITPNFGANTFDLTPDPIEGIDNAGHVIRLDDRGNDIPYEDTGSALYFLGLKYIEIPSGVYANPRTGVPEYDKWEEEVGEVEAPTSVTDTGLGTIQFNVNSIFQSSVDHSGRTVRVWLVNPLTINPAVAFEDCTVTYSAPNNLITTAAKLGQSTISVTQADYRVACLGVTIRKDTANPFGDEYIDLGYITGGSGTDTSDQRDLSGGGGHTLQRAYDGVAGDGSGRNITAEDQAVELRQEATTNRETDVANAVLRLRKDLNTTKYPGGFNAEYGLDITERFGARGAVIGRVGLADYSANDFLRHSETINITADGNDITFTRSGVDLTFSGTNQDLMATLDMVEISGSTLGNDGLYLINSVVSGTVLDLHELDGSTDAPLVIESGLTARIYRPFATVGLSPTSGIRLVGLNDFRREVVAPPIGSGVMEILLPSGTHVDEFGIRVYCGGDVFTVGADGDIDTGGRIDAYGDINTSHGDISAGLGSVTCGGVVAATSNISSSAGDISAPAGTLSCDGDITTDTGDLVSTAGSAFVLNTFEYSVAHNRFYHVGPSQGIPKPITGGFSYQSGVWVATADLDEVHFPIHIPNFANIKTINFLVNPSAVSPDYMTVRFMRRQIDYTTPDSGSDAEIAHEHSVGTSLETVTIDLGTGHSLDCEDYYYFLIVEAGAAGDIFHAARINYEQLVVIPAG